MASQLDTIIKQLNKKEDIPIISIGVPKRQWSNIPFSSPNLNWMCYGGIPKGTIVEFAGEENGRKNNNSIRFSSKRPKTI